MRFYKNLSDDLHCFQASLKMVLSIYFPSEEFSFKQIDKATGFKKDKGTWDARGFLWLAKKGFRIIRISDFDYKRFADEGEKYLKWFWMPEVYEYQKKYSDFKNAQRAVKGLLDYANFIFRRPLLSDIDKYARKEGSTMMASVNPKVLDHKGGYGNHVVVIESISKKYVVFSDPGLPPEPHRKVTRSLFKKALFELIVITPASFK